MNIIKIPSDHEMFSRDFEGELDNFIYDEFGIMITENRKISVGVCVLFDKEIEGTEIQLVVLDGKPIDNICYTIKFNEKNNDGIDVFCDNNEYKYLNIGHDLAQLVFRVMIYIMSTPRKREEKPIIPKYNKNKEMENKKRSNNRENEIFLLDEIVEYVRDNDLKIDNKGTHKINCPCWCVRGHYRHYKSGKTIFVENYKKGKERENKEPKSKTYTV